MDNPCTPDRCQDCSARLVCRCLQITEEAVVEAITTLALTTLKEVRQLTGAGDGCNACHQRLNQVLAEHAYASSSSSPVICSVR
jgi:NifU-like protein